MSIGPAIFCNLKENSYLMSGHIFDMVNRIAQNKVRKRKKFRENNRDTIYSENKATSIEYDFPKVSKYEMERIKFRIQSQAKADNRKSFYFFLVSLLIAALLVWAFVSFYTPGNYLLY